MIEIYFSNKWSLGGILFLRVAVPTCPGQKHVKRLVLKGGKCNTVCESNEKVADRSSKRRDKAPTMIAITNRYHYQ